MDLKPGYQQTELGVIPEDWEIHELGELRPFVTSGSRGWADYYSQYGDLFVRITNLTRKSIYLDLADCKFVQLPQNNSEGVRTQLCTNDVLISITADIGIIGYIDDNVPKPAYINQHIALVRLDPEVANARFVSYYLASEEPQKKFQASTDTGAKAGMSLAGVQKVKTLLPPTIEQSAIATALSDVDALLATQDALIEKKRAIKQGAMQELLTGKRRLPGFSGDWDKKRLGDHLRFLRNGTNSRAELGPEGNIKYLHYGDIHVSSESSWDVATRELPYLPQPKAERLARLEEGDLVFADASEDLTGVGKSIEIFNVSEQQVVAGLHTIAVRFDKSVLADGYKAYLQFTPDFRNQLLRLVAGTKVLSTNRAHISGCELALPEVEEQLAIVRVLSAMHEDLAALEFKRKKTAQLKQGMMQQLLTGKTRLV